MPGEAAAAAPGEVAPAARPAEPDVPPPPPPPPAEGPLTLNFKDASLQAVMEYLSEAAGLVVVVDAPLEGRVTLMSRQPVTTDEAVALLDTVLKENGYAGIYTGRTLKIVSLERAAKENLPVFSGNDPDLIPSVDRLVTQVIPVKYADATRLRQDLASLLPTTATLTANQASNSLVLVDTQASIRRFVEIVRALDANIGGVADVKVFQLKYANATNTARLITDLFKADQGQQGAQQSARQFFPFLGGGPGGGGDRGGRGGSTGSAADQQGRQQKVIASADDRTNTLVVSAPPDLLILIERVVKDLDSNPSEEEAVFIYALKNANAVALEAVLNNIFSEYGTTGTGGAAQRAGGAATSRFGGRTSTTSSNVAQAAGDLVGQVFVVADESTNSLLVRTATKHFDRVKEILAELDRAIRQVLIKVLIAEVTHDDELDIGAEYSILNVTSGAALDATVDLGGTPERTSGLVTLTMTAAMSATFNALQREGRLDVLSRPYILASDNQAASITVGQEVPFIRNSRTTEAGQIINTIEYEDVGIILNVTPHVNPDGLVIMTVAPEISALSDTTVPISEAVNATVINKRSAETQVAIRNGQTIVIGGLMEDRITDAVRKVPVLGDIPILGGLFRRVAKQKIKTELLIFITPHVAEQPDHLTAMSEDELGGVKSVREAGGEGAFEEHLESLKRGATPKPEAMPDGKQPKTGLFLDPEVKPEL
jgi:general secretion pathway protein D